MRRFPGTSHPDSRFQRRIPARICIQPSQFLPYPFPGDDAPRRLDRHPKRDLLANGFVSAGRLQSAIDLMAACYATVPLCLFQLRPLSSHLSRNFKWRMDSIRKIIPLDVPEVLEVLQFWSDPSQVAEGVPLGYQPSGQTLTTDASSYG